MDYTIEEKYDLIKKELLHTKEVNPINILKSIMHKDFINMHGPEHHFLDGAALLTALRNSGLDINLDSCLDLLQERTIKMPGAMCGFWGVCGSVTSIGAALSIIDKTGPLSNDESYANHMEFTSRVINVMSEIGGPRCCKRNAFISVTEGIKYANEKYGLNMPINNIGCEFSNLNKQCLNKKCPFHNK